MEFDHHSTVHLGSVHVIDTLHIDQVLIILALNSKHLLVAILILLIIQMLMDWNVLKMVLILLLATECKLGALV